MQGLLAETVIPLSTAARMFPGSRGGEAVNPSTVFRWATRGTRAPDGSRVKLEVIRAGGRILTSREAVGRYVERLTSAGGVQQQDQVRTPAARESASRDAARELERIGA